MFCCRWNSHSATVVLLLVYILRCERLEEGSPPTADCGSTFCSTSHNLLAFCPSLPTARPVLSPWFGSRETQTPSIEWMLYPIHDLARLGVRTTMAVQCIAYKLFLSLANGQPVNGASLATVQPMRSSDNVKRKTLKQPTLFQAALGGKHVE